MDDAKWARWAALGGVLFVVLNVVGAAITGEPPAPNDSVAKITEYLDDKGTALQVAQALGGVGSVGLLWWFGSLWRRMSHAENGRHRLSVVSLGGLVLSAALFLASGAVSTAASMRVEDLGDNAATFWVLTGVLLAGAGFGLTLHLGATSMLALRTQLFPRWIAYLGLAAAIGFLVAGVTGSTTDASGPMIIGLFSFLAWSVWILAVSATMWRTPATASATDRGGATT
jgi:hypothetical protein